MSGLFPVSTKNEARYRVDWRPYKACFSDTMRPSDIDGFIERRGCMLFMEWKTTTSGFDKLVSEGTGQGAALRKITQLPEAVLVVIQGDQTGDAHRHLVMVDQQWIQPVQQGESGLCQTFSLWDEWANMGGEPLVDLAVPRVFMPFDKFYQWKAKP